MQTHATFIYITKRTGFAFGQGLCLVFNAVPDFLFTITEETAAVKDETELQEIHEWETDARAQLPAFLENSNPRNVKLYERFGFRVTREITARKDAPPLFAMLRPGKNQELPK